MFRDIAGLLEMAVWLLIRIIRLLMLLTISYFSSRWPYGGCLVGWICLGNPPTNGVL
jgi:hypothetical protein